MGKVEIVRERATRFCDAIKMLSDKWRVTVLYVLRPGPLRATHLQRAIGGISPKMLTQTLRGLERDGLVERRVLNAVPSHVEYSLTDMGKSVIPLLRDLCRWAERHSTARHEARRRFDEFQQSAAKGSGGVQHAAGRG